MQKMLLAQWIKQFIYSRLLKCIFVPTFPRLSPLLRHKEMDVCGTFASSKCVSEWVSKKRLLNSPFTLHPWQQQKQFWTMILNVASFGYCEEGLKGSHGFQLQVKGRAGTLAQRRDSQWWSPWVHCQVWAVLLWQWPTAADLWLIYGCFQSQDFFPTHCKIFHVLHQWQDQAQAPSRSGENNYSW